MDPYHRHIPFEKIFNFRDLGGYKTCDGRVVLKQQLFRSGELQHMTENDANKLRETIGLVSIIDLRSMKELEQQSTGLVSRMGIKYYNIRLTGNPDSNKSIEQFKIHSNMGEIYLHLLKHTEIGTQMAEALKIIAEPENRPLVFHCAAGKDRTGILTTVILSLLGVSDDDIIKDYEMTSEHMEGLMARIKDDPVRANMFNRLPDYVNTASPESMALFLSGVKKEYGSINEFMISKGLADSLVQRLKNTMLT